MRIEQVEYFFLPFFQVIGTRFTHKNSQGLLWDKACYLQFYQNNNS